MSRRSRGTLWPAALLAGALGMPGSVAEAELADPTRPELLAPGLAGEATATPGAGPGARLQSVFISRSERIAVIDGRRLGLGDRVGSARIVGIELSGVRLRDAEGDWVLKLAGDRVPGEPGNER